VNDEVLIHQLSRTYASAFSATSASTISVMPAFASGVLGQEVGCLAAWGHGPLLGLGLGAGFFAALLFLAAFLVDT
jgi:hypothetical protein